MHLKKKKFEFKKKENIKIKKNSNKEEHKKLLLINELKKSYLIIKKISKFFSEIKIIYRNTDFFKKKYPYLKFCHYVRGFYN